MAGFANDVVFANNGDFSTAGSSKGQATNGLLTNGQMWIGSTATNVGGTHINVGTLTSPDSSITVGYSSPNITLQAGFVGTSTYFQAYRTTNQTVAAGNTTTTIIFDTAVTNVGSAYNTGTGIFTAPATGYYGFSSTVFFSNLTTPSGLTQIILGYTGSVQSLRLEQFGLVPATTGAALICTASWAMPMTSGNTIKMQPFADGTGNYIIAGAALSSSAFNTASTFSGWRIA